MASLTFIGNYNNTQTAALVFASAADTPGVSNAAVFQATVDWGDGGQITKYDSTSGAVGNTSGLIFGSNNNERVVLYQTVTDSRDVAYYPTGSNQRKEIKVTGGWIEPADYSSTGHDSSTNKTISLPPQTVTRHSDNNFLNSKKGAIDISVRDPACNGIATGSRELVFKFAGDYVGLSSNETIKLIKWNQWSINSFHGSNFTLASDSDTDVTYENGILKAGGKVGEIKYYYTVQNVTYSGVFEVCDVSEATDPVIGDFKHMITHKHKIDTSKYDSIINPLDGSTIYLHNKVKFYRVNVGEGFSFNGEGDFAGYDKLGRIEPSSSVSAAENMNNTFLGCVKLKYSDLVSSTGWLDNVKSLIGFMSGCGMYTDQWKIPPITSTTEDVTGMFEYSSYMSGGVKTWDVTNLKTVESLFEGTVYNKAGISDNWPGKTGNIKNFKNMFKNNPCLNQYLGNIITNEATNMEGMFYNCRTFNTGVDQWDTSGVETFKNVFKGAINFTKPVGKWKTDSATTVEGMFDGAKKFNSSLWPWNFGKVKTMKNMFRGCDMFDQPLKFLNISAVESVEGMFDGAKEFNQNINNWSINNITTFKNMFKGAVKFNNGATSTSPAAAGGKPAGWQPMFSWINKFNDPVSLEGMFQSSAFDQKISNWDVAGVTSIKNMFKNNTSFSKELFPGWKLKQSNLTSVEGFLDGANVSNSELKAYTYKMQYVPGFAVMFGENDDSVVSANKSTVYDTVRTTWEENNGGGSTTGDWQSDYKLDSSGDLEVITVVPTPSTSFEIVGDGGLSGKWTRVRIERQQDDGMGESTTTYTHIWINNVNPVIATHFISHQSSNSGKVGWFDEIAYNLPGWATVGVWPIRDGVDVNGDGHSNMGEAFEDFVGGKSDTWWIEGRAGSGYTLAYYYFGSEQSIDNIDYSEVTMVTGPYNAVWKVDGVEVHTFTLAS